jgi:hypothetical protein
MISFIPSPSTECTMPIEYCEYSGKYEKCQQWLERNLPDLAKQQLRVDDGGGEGGADGETAATGTAEDKKHQVGVLGSHDIYTEIMGKIF